MFTPSTSTSTTATFSSRQTPTVISRSTTGRDTEDMSRTGMQSPRQQAAASPDDWTRECLFDCYND